MAGYMFIHTVTVTGYMFVHTAQSQATILCTQTNNGIHGCAYKPLHVTCLWHKSLTGYVCAHKPMNDRLHICAHKLMTNYMFVHTNQWDCIYAQKLCTNKWQATCPAHKPMTNYLLVYIHQCQALYIVCTQTNGRLNVCAHKPMSDNMFMHTNQWLVTCLFTNLWQNECLYKQTIDRLHVWTQKAMTGNMFVCLCTQTNKRIHTCLCTQTNDMLLVCVPNG